MKKLILVLFLSLFLAMPAFAASREEWELAEYLAQPQAKSVVSGNSVVFEVYYNDNTQSRTDYAQIGVSDVTSAPVLNLYEDGAVVSSTRFSADDGAIDLNVTLKKLASKINADTSGYWKASIGSDGWDSMDTKYILAIGKTDANVSKESPVEFNLDNDELCAFSAGVKADTGARARLKYIEEATIATEMPHWIEVYSGDNCVYRHGFTNAESAIYARSETLGEEATPNVVNLAEGHKGLGGNKDDNLVVVTRWNLNGTLYAGANSPTTGNLSIIYDVIKP